MEEVGIGKCEVNGGMVRPSRAQYEAREGGGDTGSRGARKKRTSPGEDVPPLSKL